MLEHSYDFYAFVCLFTSVVSPTLYTDLSVSVFERLSLIDAVVSRTEDFTLFSGYLCNLLSRISLMLGIFFQSDLTCKRRKIQALAGPDPLT